MKTRGTTAGKLRERAALDTSEQMLLADYEAGELGSVATKASRHKLEAAARATATRDHRITIRLAAEDLRNLKAHALHMGLPLPALIASILRKDVVGGLEERAITPPWALIAGTESSVTTRQT